VAVPTCVLEMETNKERLAILVIILTIGKGKLRLHGLSFWSCTSCSNYCCWVDGWRWDGFALRAGRNAISGSSPVRVFSSSPLFSLLDAWVLPIYSRPASIKITIAALFYGTNSSIDSSNLIRGLHVCCLKFYLLCF
jgi:hypothetical protein